MRISRTLLIVALISGATQSHALWSRFAKPFTARFTTALKYGSATAIGGGIGAASYNEIKLQEAKHYHDQMRFSAELNKLTLSLLARSSHATNDILIQSIHDFAADIYAGSMERPLLVSLARINAYKKYAYFTRATEWAKEKTKGTKFTVSLKSKNNSPTWWE